ncbi:DUF664 domain-containing protein [Nocardioides sp. S-58]|uniref:DUF664 domain-containing protein n=1 Tax=Nocardioides renjunii TaxID=3095075 RepID=A0ABU5KA16_9ACTN|nr:DUF664 domain-containing protein [Nocardioides sp. S-58]MDZ5661314.1 DUF664 domain-containing protein [Nocardioides sp. S-58]
MSIDDSTTEDATDATDVWVPPPWEPPLDGTEVEHLLGALGRQRATVRWKADGLDEAGLRHRLPSSQLSLGGLLLHLAMGEDYYLVTKLRGERLVEPWRSLGHDGTDEWELTTESLSAAEVYDAYDEAVRRNDARIEQALAEGGLDLVAHVDDGNGNHPRLRRLLFDMIEEYARHTGHADLLREAVDGRVGEDPPDDWQPPAGR